MPLNPDRRARDFPYDPDAIVSPGTTKASPLYIQTDPSTGAWTGKYSKQKPTDQAPGWIAVPWSEAMTNDGREFIIVLGPNGQWVSEIGEPLPTTKEGSDQGSAFRSAKKAEDDRLAREKREADDKAAAAARADAAVQAAAERKIVDVSTQKDPTGKWVKVTKYQTGPDKIEQVDPTVSVSTTEINGKKFSIATTTTPDNKQSYVFTDLSTGQVVTALPVDSASVPKNTVSLQKAGDGKIYAITIDPATGAVISRVDTGIPADTPDDQVNYSVEKGPDGRPYTIITRTPKSGTGQPTQVVLGPDGKIAPGGVPGTPAPPASAGGFIPDPRKPAMGLSEYIQTLAQLRATGAITDEQKDKLFANAHQTALAEGNRLDIIVRAQQQQAQDLITQRSNDLQTSTARLGYANAATKDAFSQAVDIAKQLTPKTLAAAGGDVLGPILTLQEARAGGWGGLYSPPTLTPQPGTAWSDIGQMGMLPGQQTNAQAVGAAAATGAAQQAQAGATVIGTPSVGAPVVPLPPAGTLPSAPAGTPTTPGVIPAASGLGASPAQARTVTPPANAQAAANAGPVPGQSGDIWHQTPSDGTTIVDAGQAGSPGFGYTTTGPVQNPPLPNERVSGFVPNGQGGWMPWQGVRGNIPPGYVENTPTPPPSPEQSPAGMDAYRMPLIPQSDQTGNWFSPGQSPQSFGVPSGDSWFGRSGGVPQNQPIQSAASMHPIVGSLMQQYANDPGMQQAIMEEAMSGGLI